MIGSARHTRPAAPVGGLALVVLVLGSLVLGVQGTPAEALATARGQSCGSYALAAPTGGRELIVAQDGSGHYSSINAAATAARAGDVVTITNGTYAESVTVAGAGTATAPIVFQAQNCGGVVLTGAGNSFKGSGFVPNQAPQNVNGYVVVRGLNFVDFGTALTGWHEYGAINMTLGWKLEDVSVTNSGGWAAVQIRGHQAVIDQATIASSPRDAVYAAGSCCVSTTYGAPGQLKGLRLTNAVLHGNNTGRHSPNWEAVTKFMQTDDLLVDNIESFANNGAGLWLDWQNYRYVIRNSSFHDNVGVENTFQGAGLILEIYSEDGVVENNHFQANSGPDLLISATSRIDVRNNVFQGSSTDKGSQVEFLRGKENGECTRPKPLAVTIRSNQFLDWGGPWGYAAIATTNDPARSYTCPQDSSPVTANHMFDFNTYRIASYSGALVGWEGIGAYSVSEMQNLWGFERGTSTAPQPVPTDTSAPTVNIISPSAGTMVGRSVSIAASAADNVGVTKMELYIDGSLRMTTSGGSLGYAWNTKRVTSGSHTIVVRAYDGAGNAAQSSVTVYK